MDAKGIEELKTKADALEAKINEVEAKNKSLEEQAQKVVAAGNAVVGNKTGSDEQKALRFFGKKSAAELMNVNVGDSRFKHVPDSVKATVLQLKEAMDISRWVSQCFYGAQKDSSEKAGNVGEKIYDSYFAKNELVPRLKAFDTSTDSSWVPTIMASSFIEEFELDRVVASMFRRVDMPSNPYDWPIQDSTTTGRIIGENAQISDAKFDTDKLTFSATKLGEHYKLTEEMNEDSAPAIMAAARQEVVDACARAIEQAILNGDTAATHQDSDVTAADDARKSWDGLRKFAIAKSALGLFVDGGNSAITDILLRNLRGALGKHGMNPRALAWIAGPQIINQLLLLDQVVTIDKFGPAATVVRGSLGNIFGIPIISSEFVREDLNATGVYDGVTTDRTCMHVVDLRRWYMGIRRPIRVRVMQDLADYDRWLLAAYTRQDFRGVLEKKDETSTAMLYNLALS